MNIRQKFLKKTLRILIIVFIFVIGSIVVNFGLRLVFGINIVSQFTANSFVCPLTGGTYVEKDLWGRHACIHPGDLILFKPVIYLYPTAKTNVAVTFPAEPQFLVTYPAYNSGWNVIAYPSGRLLNQSDHKEYNYLYWEASSNPPLSFDLTKGFVVKGKDTAQFLQRKLAAMGLTPKEYNEFIVYWLPRMIGNPYNLIHFASDAEYNQKIPLNISPKPDSMLRVYMVFKPLQNDLNVQPQEFELFYRKGFSVVEWGGSEL